MLDFLKINKKQIRNGNYQVFPTFNIYPKPKDLMVRGGDFYAIWIADQGMWCTDEDVALALIDAEINKYMTDNAGSFDKQPQIMYMRDSDTGCIDSFHRYCQKQIRDNFKPLDESLVFSNTETNRESHASKKLSYPLEPGDHSAWDKIVSTLYSPEERHKIEWIIGSIVSGDSRFIQKFCVLYGAAGTGKSTVLNIIQQLFDGYYCTFDAKALGSVNSQFSLEPFKENPLVAIQHDGDLSRIEDNARLNSLVSHERLNVNTKFGKLYETSFKAFLFLGTNRPVKITDAKSGLLRRLIDVTPTGKKIPSRDYKTLTKKVEFQLGAIASHCLEVYKEDPDYYDTYIPKSMMGASNDFYNFISESYSVFKKEDGVTLKSAWEMYKNYVEEAKVPYPMSKMYFKEELKNYFWNFDDNAVSDDGTRLRSWYSKFKIEIFSDDIGGPKPKKSAEGNSEETKPTWLEFNCTESIFDKEYGEYPAQYAGSNDKPVKAWADVTSILDDLSTSRVHYVKVPEIHIVVDFDIKDEDGNKSFEKNLEAASKWPPTYAELSKSGGGIHLHYNYTGDPAQLSRIYDDDIEIKVFSGGSSLRRKLTKCNDLPIANISSGLPLKEGGKNVINSEGVKSERALRSLVKRHLNKEIMGNTAPSVQMIKKVLDEAYDSGMGYDLSDMRNYVYTLAASSNNQAPECLKLVNNMKFKSEDVSETESKNEELVFYDVEDFPNLLLVNWKIAGEGNPVVRMINPTPSEIEELLRFRLIGFNNRKYDNHILYGRLMGYTNEELYKLSQRIVSNDRYACFGEAYNLSYADVYDFAAKKQSLKKWEIELGIHHQELGLPWDQPVPESKWVEVAEYCDNDVKATEAVFLNRHADWTTRQLLAELSGLSVNDTNRMHITRYIFGTEKNPELLYTDLATGEQQPGR